MTSQKPTDLYLVSSTLHFFWAWLLAFKNKPHRQAYLWFIDQYSDKPMAFLPFIDQVESPFVEWRLFSGREKTGLQKLKHRSEMFKVVEKWASDHSIDRVFIGNDRSVMGQFVIKTLKAQAKAEQRRCKGCFLDDGVFTYLGRAASQSWSEKYLDAVAKKVIYGFWYDPPVTVGASKWIDEAWVMYPEHVSPYLAHKKKVAIFDINEGLACIEPLSKRVLESKGVEVGLLQELDVLITLPNETIFSKIEGYRENIKKLVTDLQKQNKKIAVKYHPAAGDRDILNLEALGVVKLPADVSFEMLIIQLEKCDLIGDLSTTVLLAQYIRPIINLDVYSMASENNRVKALFTSLGILGFDDDNVKKYQNITL